VSDAEIEELIEQLTNEHDHQLGFSTSRRNHPKVRLKPAD
jgi:hypothetical protein